MLYILFIIFYLIPLIAGFITCGYCIFDKKTRYNIANPFTTNVFVRILLGSIIPGINAFIFYEVTVDYISKSNFMNKQW